MDISINLFVQDIKQSIKFYQNVFGASIQDGCHFKIENYPFALAEVKENTPKSRGGVGLCLQIYLKDIDNILVLAFDNGGQLVAPGTPENPFFIAHGQRVINIEVNSHSTQARSSKQLFKSYFIAIIIVCGTTVIGR